MDSRYSPLLVHFSVANLKRICRTLKLSQVGRKADLISRISSVDQNDENSECLKELTKELEAFRNRNTDTRIQPKPKPVQSIGPAPISPNSWFLSDSGKCYCNGSVSDSQMFTCILCKSKNHARCVFFQGDQSNYICPHCHLINLDPFQEVLKVMYIGKLNPKGEGGSWTSIAQFGCSELRAWRLSGAQLIVRCVRSGCSNRTEMEWPIELEIIINDDHKERIKEANWEHKRRDKPLAVTQYFVNMASNKISFNAKCKADSMFVIGIFLCGCVEVSTLKQRVFSRGQCSLTAAKQRVEKLLNNDVDGKDDDDVTCLDMNRKITLSDPVSLMRIEIPVRGSKCQHLQCFCLESFLTVTKGTAAFNSRWKCPVCHLFTRPEDLVVDGYVAELLQVTTEQDKTIEIMKDGSWRVVLSESDNYISSHNHNHNKTQNSVCNNNNNLTVIKQEEETDNNIISYKPDNIITDNNVQPNNITVIDCVDDSDSEQEEKFVTEDDGKVEMPPDDDLINPTCISDRFVIHSPCDGLNEEEDEEEDEERPMKRLRNERRKNSFFLHSRLVPDGEDGELQDELYDSSSAHSLLRRPLSFTVVPSRKEEGKEELTLNSCQSNSFSKQADLISDNTRYSDEPASYNTGYDDPGYSYPDAPDAPDTPDNPFGGMGCHRVMMMMSLTNKNHYNRTNSISSNSVTPPDAHRDELILIDSSDDETNFVSPPPYNNQA